MWSWTNPAASLNPNFANQFSPYQSSTHPVVSQPHGLLPFHPQTPSGYHDYNQTLPSLPFQLPSNQRMHSSSWHSLPLESGMGHALPPPPSQLSNTSLQHHISPDTVHHKHHTDIVLNNPNQSIHLPPGAPGPAMNSSQEPPGTPYVSNNRPFSVDFLLQKSGSPSNSVGYGNSLSTGGRDQFNDDQSNYTAIDYTSGRAYDTLPSYHSGPHLPHVEPSPDNSLTPPTIPHRTYNQSDSTKQFGDQLAPPPTQYSLDYTPPTHSNDEAIGLTIPTEEPYSPPELIVKDDTITQSNDTTDSVNNDTNNGSFLESGNTNNGGYSLGGLHLGMSPPSIREPPKSLVNEKYESSNSSDEETHHEDNIIEKTSKPYQDASQFPPPLVSTETAPPQQKKSKLDDDDDVFLPVTTKVLSVDVQETDTTDTVAVGGAVGGGTSEVANDEETRTDKSPMMVIGRRGRAAGKVLDESKLRVPLENGWQRVVRTRVAEGNGSSRVDICYVTPCNHRLRTFPEIQRYLLSNKITHLTLDHFTFSKKVNVGVVIDDNSSTNEGKLLHPRRGRPPKRPNVLKQSDDIQAANTDGSRISLEPYEIKQPLVSDLPLVSTVTVPPTQLFSEHFSTEEAIPITKVINQMVDHNQIDVNTSERNHVTTPSVNVTTTSVNMTTPSSVDSMTSDIVSHVTTSNHMDTSSSHMATSSNHMTISSNHMATSSNHMATSSSHMDTSSSHMTTLSSHMATSSNHMDTSSSHMATSSNHMTTSSNHMATSSSHMDISSSHMDISSSHMAIPSSHMTIPSSHMTIPSSHVTTSSSHLTTLPQATPPLLISDEDSSNKRSRGRPKHSKGKVDNNGVIQQSNGSNRKGRKPKHITRILQTSNKPLLTANDNNIDGSSDNNIGGTVDDITPSAAVGITSDDTVEQKQVTKKAAVPKEKKRQILQANKVRKKAESTQQTRRQRERALIKQAKERQEKVNKQKEAEWQQLRKSKLAKQRQEQNQLKARERTLRLVEEIQQKEQERDRILRVRQLEMQKAEQLRRPIEDLLVNDLIDLPTLSKIKWIHLPSNSFADLVMVFEFCHSFEDFLELESIPKFPEVYRGLFNIEKETTPNNEYESSFNIFHPGGLMTLVIHLLKAVVHDNVQKFYTLSGHPLRDIDVREDTLSEILRLYLFNKRSKPLSQICDILEQYPYQSLRPTDKITVLSFLVDELLNSTSLCREIDNRMEQISTLRRDKWKISLKLKRFRSRLTDVFGIQSSHKPVVYSGRGRPPKRAFLNNGMPTDDIDSSDEEGVANEPAVEDAPIIDDDTSYSDEDSDEEIPTEKDELQKRVKELKKKFVQVRSKIHTMTRLMRKFPLGQDRYTRQYWNLPELGGVLIEGTETSHNKYLNVLFPEEIKRRDSNNNDSDQTESLTPSYTVESTSEVVLSSQSSPYPQPTHNTPAADSNINPLSTNDVMESSHPLEVQLSANTAHVKDHVDHTSLSPPTLITSNHVISNEVNAPSTDSVTPPHFTAPPTSTATPTEQLCTPPAPPTSTEIVSDATTTSYQDMLWFSLLPRKPCELLHFIQSNTESIQQQQQTAAATGIMNSGGQYILPAGTGYYMTSDGSTVLGQPLLQQVQVGYAVVGNTLVPQTQYVLSQNPVANGNTAQYISLGNGQLAVASNNIQYVGGNQYAIVQQEENTVAAGTSTDVVHSTADNESVVATTSKSSHHHHQEKEHKRKKKKNKSEAANESSESQQMITLAIPTGAAGETQYIQLPADARVLSGQCSYAIMPQGDGTSQIVLVENASLTSNGVDNSSTSEVLKLECAAANILDNEYEFNHWMVDITLMYADTPLPFMGNENVIEEKVEDKTPLNVLLQDISKDLREGWWTLTSPLEIDYLLRCLTMRGYREKNLHKMLQKNKDGICAILKADILTTPPLNENNDTSNNGDIKTDQSHDQSRDLKEEIDDEKQEVPVTMETDQPTDDMTIPEPIETKEATPPSKATPNNETEDQFVVEEMDPFFPMETKDLSIKVVKYLIAMEVRLFDAHLQNKGIVKEIYQSEYQVDNTSNNELISIADRLLRFEGCVQRRYLKPPFIDKQSLVTITTDDSANSPAPECIALVKWRNCISHSVTISQLAVCLNQLEKCIAWEKSPMKVFCVICQTGDNESLLLLCDRCDRGTHTYCCRPKLDNIPEGNWYCHDCTINASRKTACGVCQSSRGTLLHCNQCPKVFHKRCLNPPLTKMPTNPWVCSDCRSQQKRKPGRPRSSKEDLLICQAMLMELEDLDDAWPFLEPVNRKKIPDYYRVIKKPMDFLTIKQKLQEGKYSNKDSFATDVRLVFDNCSYYNEDNSEIGMAGHTMRQFFERKWSEMT